MSFRVSFGLSEIFAIFGSFALIQANYMIGLSLVALGVMGAFIRFALEMQAKKESNEKIENVANVIKDAILTPSNWGGFSTKNMH